MSLKSVKKVNPAITPRFWETKSLEKMNAAEWDALCDGCGKCCLNKFQDEDTDEVLFTNVACAYLDLRSLRCRCWETRSQKVKDCVVLTPALVKKVNWLPETCAYRLLAEGKPLYDWHPLISGVRSSVATAGVSVRGKIISEREVHPDYLEEFIVKWIN
jgi:uncharacterized cysteine cluster protein YcgN (CxxCxxCC family)